MSAKVAEAINAVMGKVGYIQKKGTNSFHNYKFAAIGDVLAELQPAMHDAGLIVIQDEVGNELLEGGSIMTARYAFSLLHKSGEVWPTVAHHTGMAAAKSKNGTPDDKALNKCHTAARKYFLMALFQIPTGDHVDPDADGDVPTKNAASGVKPNGQEPKQEKHSGMAGDLLSLRIYNGSTVGRMPSAEAKRKGYDDELKRELHECQSIAEVAQFLKERQNMINTLPLAWLEPLENQILNHEAELRKLSGGDQ